MVGELMIKPANPAAFMSDAKGLLEHDKEGGLFASALRALLRVHDEQHIDPACGNEMCPNYGFHPPWLDCTEWIKGD